MKEYSQMEPQKPKQLKLNFNINNVKYKIEKIDKTYTLTTGKTIIKKKALDDLLIELRELVMAGIQKGTMHEFCEDIKEAVSALRACTKYIKKEMSKHVPL